MPRLSNVKAKQSKTRGGSKTIVALHKPRMAAGFPAAVGAMYRAASIKHIELGEGDVSIVISQSCDVVCESLDAEPFVDVQIGRTIAAVDGNNTYGKNPRIVDFQDNFSGEPRNYRCRDAERSRLDRTILLGTIPAGILSPSNVRLLANWTGRRYTRPAFPDEFNRRRRAVAPRVAKIGRELAHDVASLYVILNEDRELPVDEIYEIILVGTVIADVAIDASRFAGASKAVASIAKALSGNGITVVDAVARSEDDVSLTEVRQMIRFDLDYISIRAGIEEMSPEEG